MPTVMALLRGEISLRRAVWLYGVAGSLILALPVNLTTAMGANNHHAVMSVYCVMFLAYIVLAMIGIWRSASRYHGFVFWPWLTKFSVAVVAAGAIAGFVQGLTGGMPG